MRLLTLLALLPFVAPAQTPEQIEFFEKKIRPVLAEKCYVCHSAATAAMGELRLDTRAATLKGGSRGAAVVPGDPNASVLLSAVSYKKIDLRMPPTGKLSDDEIADLRAWIDLGAPDPRDETVAEAEEEPAGIDLEERSRLWSFQPMGDPAPPSPKRADWVRTPVDAFLAAKLEEHGLEPRPEADKRTLIRRLTFDLTGLPPTPEEIDAFLADRSPDAYEKLTQRLLASPHYGERWARHWLDLVRFAETNGHEFDNEKLDAWRYRDWVIRAFNEDLPYDRFVKEQIAGDLMQPRLVSGGNRYETPIASGFYWLWEVLNSPTDSVQARADQVDNQIDVFGKAFLGLTIACARCHDHKFDPIPTADYYSLAGVFHSTQMAEKCIDSRDRAAEIIASRDSLTAIADEMRDLLREARLKRARKLDERLLEAAAELTASRQTKADEARDAQDKEAPKPLLEEALLEPSDPLFPFARLAEESEEPYWARLDYVREEMAEWVAKAQPDHPIWKERGDTLFEDFEDGFGRWRVEGAAFGDQPQRTHAPDQALLGWGGRPVANSFSGGDELVGALTTAKFRMPKRWVHVRLAGTKISPNLADRAKLRMTIVADDHRSAHAMADGSGRMRWKTLSMTKEHGRQCYIEITDRGRQGHIAVERIVFSDSPDRPPIAGPPHSRVLALLKSGASASLEDLAAAYRDLAVELLGKESLDADEQALLAALEAPLSAELASSLLVGAARERYDELAARRASLRASLPPSAFAMSSIDVNPRNVRIHLRGSHKVLGEEVPRRALQAISESAKPFTDGSGRLELAEWTASERNPLTARVMVNRVWKQHFGQGLVRTTDNFGMTGERPTHPELLDFLASRFVESGWSVKALHRLIVLSSAYRMDSRVSAKAAEIDPANKLVSHMPVRRLEGEAIRDAALAVAGTLKGDLYGPSVPPHISAYQDGRGKPKSGPLDGAGRRSIYIQPRRNFLTPLFLAFDYPLPTSTVGNRGVSAVPSQALMLLNNELIHQQAGEWARAEIKRSTDPRARVENMFVRAYARPPTAAEQDEIRSFLAEQLQRREGDEQTAWSDLAHVLFNSTEFIFVR